MAKNWYPIINYSDCIKCGACVDKCEHGVYDKSKAPTPIIINLESCVDGCKGCANLCPENAIIYFGDESLMDDCSCCSCSCDGDYKGC